MIYILVIFFVLPFKGKVLDGQAHYIHEKDMHFALHSCGDNSVSIVLFMEIRDWNMLFFTILIEDKLGLYKLGKAGVRRFKPVRKLYRKRITF